MAMMDFHKSSQASLVPSLAAKDCRQPVDPSKTGQWNKNCCIIDMEAPLTPPEAQAQAVGIEQLFSACEALQNLGKADEAIQLQRDWLAGSDHPQRHLVWFNHGSALQATGHTPEAMHAYNSCLQLQPGFPQALINLGLVCEKLGLREVALTHWAAVVGQRHMHHKPDQAMLIMAINHMGRVQEDMRQYAAAEQTLAQSLSIDPHQVGVLQHWIYIRQKACAWPVYQALPGISAHQQLMATSPLAMLAMVNDPVQQLLTAHAFVGRTYSFKHEKPMPARPDMRPKIRLGYVSGDLCTHAVGLLMPDVLEAHDKHSFEVFAYDFSPEDGSVVRERIKQAADHWRRIDHLSDAQVAEVIKADGIDILIDMHGLSAGARPGIFALRPAPHQGTYLGFIGTTAMPWLDFVVTDAVACPHTLQPYFTEHLLHMEGCFIPMAVDAASVGKDWTRSELGLPEQAFVLAAFCNTYKINAELLNSWAQILKATAHTVLWLIDDNDNSTHNLQSELGKLGVPINRVVFSKRLGHGDYQKALRRADLFLDSFPYNCGSTAKDILTAGVPLLTLQGHTFVSRMASSMLAHIGLHQLIAHTSDQYVQRAIGLAGRPSTHQALCAQLAQAIASDAHFKPHTFTPRFEKALKLWLAGRQTTPLHPFSKPVSVLAPEMFTIAYSESTWAGVQAPMKALDNRSNPRPDWQEYWPMRQFLLSQTLDEQRLYGFFSPRFTEKTSLSAQALQDWAMDQGRDADVMIICPQADMGAFFKNVFVQNELFDPGFLVTAQAFVDHIGWPMDLAGLVMDARHIVFSNYVLAKPAFWRRWLAITEALFQVCESSDEHTADLRAQLLTDTNYRQVQRKVFLLERLASLLLKVEPHWRVVAYNTFDCAWSGSRLHAYPEDAVVCDALKLAHAQQGFGQYMDAFDQHIHRLSLKLSE